MKSQKNDMPRVETPSVFKGIYNITFFTVYSVSLLVGSVSKLDNSGPLVRSGPHFSHYHRYRLKMLKTRPIIHVFEHVCDRKSNERLY